MYHCSTCNKTFKHASVFRRHRNICEILKLSKYQREIKLEETADIPSREELWDVVKTLVERQETLLKEIDSLKNWVKTRKKKISIIDWLNENIEPNINYDEWLENIDPKSEDLYKIFNHGFVLGFMEILKNELSLDDEHSLPIRAFEQKTNVLFVFNKNKWSAFTLEDFQKMICNIHQKLMKHFQKWTEKNKNQAYNSNNDTYQNNVIEIMGGKQPFHEAIRKIKVKMFKYLKFNLKNIIQYEFSY